LASVIKKSQCLLAIAGSQHTVAGSLQYQFDQVDYGMFIIDDQYRWT
jgi:hypothetical protein